MAETRQGNEFNENQILDLTQDKAARIWYKMCNKRLFHGIEWNSLSAELVNKHCSLFELDEVAKLSSDNHGRKEAVTSAVGRDAPRVLHAFYLSLCATTTCGGATQHASIAEEIQRETMSAAIFKAYSYPPASNSDLILPPGWPTPAQLSSAVPDFGHNMAQAYARDGATQSLRWQTTGAQGCGSGTVPVKQKEEWEGVVKFVRHHFGGNARRDMVSALHREVVETSCHFFPPSSQQISEALQEVVKERRMTWFAFARYLLRSKRTRLFVFEISKYTHASIRDVFKQALEVELGKFWTQLAEEMGVARTHIDDLQERTDVSLLQKINAFLVKYPFPAFESDADTKEFLVEALERVCLTNIAAAVRRNLESSLPLPLEDTRPTMHSTHYQDIAQKCTKPCIADNRKSGCPSQTADTGEAHGGSPVEDPPPPYSPGPELNQLSQSHSPGVAEKFIGPKHNPKNVPSHIEDQSGVGMQTQASQDNHTPDQSNTDPNPLWEMAEKSASTEISSAQQSQYEMASPENTENKHSHIDAHSEPVAGVAKSSNSLPPQASTPAHPPLKQHIASDTLILPTPQGRIHPKAPLEDPKLSQQDTLGGGFQDDIPLFPPPLNVVNEQSSNPENREGLSNLERDSVTARPPSEPAPSNSAQFVHLQNSSQTGSPTTGHKMHPSPSIILTKEHNPLSNAASHPTQQSAPNEDSANEETSDDDDTCSYVTFLSSTSVSTTQTRSNSCEQSRSASNHPPTAYRSQPPTTHPNPSVKVPSHLQLAAVKPLPAEVPSTIKTSGETYSSAPAVVESVHEADTTSSLDSSKSIKQPLAVPSGDSSPAMSSAPQEGQESGYLGNNQFVSSSLSPRHPGDMDPHDGMPMNSYERVRDSQESLSRADEPIGSSTEEKMLAYVSRQVAQKWSMLARYAGLEEGDIQEIKRAPAQGRSHAAMKKIRERLTWNELLSLVHKHMHMLNTAAELQSFLGCPVDALPDQVQKEIDPQKYSRTLLVASQCVSEHWKDLAWYLGVNPYEHWDVLENSSDADEKCHGVLLLWLSDKHATLRQLLEAVEHTSAGAETLQQLIEMAR